MRRILGTADLHGGLTRYGAPTPNGGNTRLDDFAATLELFVATAREREVDVAVFAGDTFNTRREGPAERAMFAKAVVGLTEAGITTVVVPGNHDGMTTVGDGDTHALRWLDALHLPGVYVGLEPGVRNIRTRSGDMMLTTLPYPHKRAFDKSLDHLHPEERVLEAGRRLDAAVPLFALARDLIPQPAIPHLLVGHLSVGGARLGSETAMKFSWDVSITPAALEPFDFALLGHIHRQQQVGPKAWYAGSPQYLDFGDMGQRKGFLLVEMGVDTEPTVEVIDSQPRPMVDVPIRLVDDGSDRYDASLIPPFGIVRAVVTVDEPRPNLSRIANLVASMRANGASYVKLMVIAPDREMAQRIDVDPTVDVLTATARWLTANGHDHQPAMELARHLVGTGGTA